MGVYTFVFKSSRGEWSAKQQSGDLEASAGTTYELQRRLVQTVLSSDSSGPVSSSFSFVTPSSAVFQVIVGGAVVVGGGAAVAAAAPGGGTTPAAEEKKEEEKKPVEEDSDEDLGFSLFD